MLCAMCGNDQARVYTRRTESGETKLYLCPDCYRRFMSGKASDTKNVRRTCPSCGTTLDEFRKTGYLGCADCYSAFREELIPTIRVLQGRLYHTGKDPVRALGDEQAELEEELADAQKTGDKLLEQRIRYRLSVIHRLLSGGDE